MAHGERDASAVLLRCEALLARPVDAQSAAQTLGALARLRQAHAPPPGAPPLQQSLVAQDEASVTAKDGAGAGDDIDVRALSDPHGVMDVSALRGELERTLLASRRDVVHAYLARLDGIVADLDALDTGLHDLHAKASAAQRQSRTAATLCAPLLASALPAQKEARDAEMQQTLTELFLRRFTLPSGLASALDQADTKVDDTTFDALDRLVRIRSEAQALLAGSDTASHGGGIRAGVDVMDTASAQLDKGLHRLSQWLLARFRDPQLSSHLELGAHDTTPDIPRAIAYLHQEGKDDLLRPVLSELADRRARLVLDKFDAALRRGSGPGERPIEAQAHDRLRYVGDMLAWVHQASAGESEVYASLLQRKAEALTWRPRRIGARRHVDSGSVDLTSKMDEWSAHGQPVEQAVSELVNRALAPLARPLRERVVSVLTPSEPLALLRLAHILDFYRVTLRRTLGKMDKSPLVLAVQDLARRAALAFDAELNRHAAGVRQAEPNRDGLAAPPYLESQAATMQNLLATASAAMPQAHDDGTSDAQARDSAQAQLSAIVTHLVGATETLCDRMASTLAPNGSTVSPGKGEAFDQGIFLVNCYTTIIAALRAGSGPVKVGPAATATERLEAQRSDLARALAETYTQRLLDQTALGVLAKASCLDTQTPLAQQDGCAPADIRIAMRLLGEKLRSGAPLEARSLSAIAEPSLRASVHAAALRGVADIYDSIVQAIRTGGYDNPDALVELEPADVRLLLGVDDA